MKNRILIAITLIAIIALALSIIAFDSENIAIPGAVMLVSLSWLALFAKANEEREEEA